MKFDVAVVKKWFWPDEFIAKTIILPELLIPRVCQLNQSFSLFARFTTY